MGWPLMEALDTQVPRPQLTTCNENYTNVGHQNEPPFFFCQPQAAPGMRAYHLFSAGEGEMEMCDCYDGRYPDS